MKRDNEVINEVFNKLMNGGREQTFEDKVEKWLRKHWFSIVYSIFIVFWLWIAGTCMVQRFKAPKMTETELFLNIPHSIILDFKKE